MLDYETVAGGDKFGNAYVLRLPEGVSDTVDADPTGISLVHDKARYNGASHKVEVHAHFNVSLEVSSPVTAPDRYVHRWAISLRQYTRRP